MALTRFQHDVLRVIAKNRSPNSLFAGGAVANRDGPRLSDDLDIEHDSADAVRTSFALDRDAIVSAGMTISESESSRPHFGFIQAVVQGAGDSVLLDWMTDTAVRFFPAVKDDRFGWRLHDADIAVNKLLALAGRRAARDYYDVVRLHERGWPLGTLAWAAMGKDAGFSPDLVLDEAARNASYSAQHLDDEIRSIEPIDAVELKRRFLTALAAARDEVAEMTRLVPESVGRLAVSRSSGNVAPLDAAAIGSGEVVFHEASIFGAWPQIASQDEEG